MHLTAIRSEAFIAKVVAKILPCVVSILLIFQIRNIEKKSWNPSTVISFIVYKLSV